MNCSAASIAPPFPLPHSPFPFEMNDKKRICVSYREMKTKKNEFLCASTSFIYCSIEKLTIITQAKQIKNGKMATHERMKY